MSESMCINPRFTCIGNVAVSLAFWASYPHTMSPSYQTLTVRFALVSTFIIQSFIS